MDSLLVKRVAPEAIPALEDGWDSPAWKPANVVSLDWQWGEKSPLQPKVQAKLLHDGRNLYGIFHVEANAVLARARRFNECVCFDSCVEFFFRPRPDKGYLNLEMSAGGAKLSSYITDWVRTEDGFQEYVQLPEELGILMPTLGSLGLVPEERKGPCTWTMAFQIPPAVPAAFLGDLGDLSGQTWTANFFSCGDHLEHQHWQAWQGVPTLNFHQPEFFGTLLFQ